MISYLIVTYISTKAVKDRIALMEKRVEDEEDRLEGVQTRLIAKYARLEKVLTLLNQQMAAVTALASVI